jgi:hypothetical protein
LGRMDYRTQQLSKRRPPAPVFVIGNQLEIHAQDGLRRRVSPSTNTNTSTSGDARSREAAPLHYESWQWPISIWPRLRHSPKVPWHRLDRVDLCIACGPFCREENLRPYCQGRQRRRHFRRTMVTQMTQQSYNNHTNTANHHQYNQSHTSSTPNSTSSSSSSHHHPSKRTREETAALEGLMTAALSQLESIVC